MISRNIHKVITAVDDEAAQGFVGHRPLPARGLRMVDPFLLLDHMGPVAIMPGKRTGVPDHPHRGFEPVTFVFEGMLKDRDSMGNHIMLKEWDVQWMTSGRGIVHSEFVAEELVRTGGVFHGVQLWVNVPAKDKMDEPKYQNIKSAEIPVVEEKNYKVRVVAGEFGSVHGPASTYTPILALNIVFSNAGTAFIPIPPEYNALVYVASGKGLVSDMDVYPLQMIHFFNHGDGIEIKSKGEMNLLLLSGEPINETVASYGPFVMNNMMEIQQAIYDYENGMMGEIFV